MAKRKDILKAALKALLAGAQASAWVKIPATFISEIASLPEDKRDALGKASAEKFDELLAQAELSTTNAALAAVGTEQIKVLVSNLARLSVDKLDALTKLTQEQYEETLSELHAIHADTEEIKTDVKELIKKVDQAIIRDHRQANGSLIPNLPYPTIGNLFKGRDDILALLRDHLDDNKPTAITQTIHGLGGIGKTRLAVEFAWLAIAEKKYQAVFFIKSETPELLHASIASLAAKDMLGLTEHGVDQQTAEIAVFQWLGTNKGWLMILDNADTEESAKVVEALLPHLAAGHVIITSRYKHWSAAVRPQPLGLLMPNDAEQFLLERTAARHIETADDESIARRLAKELGFLPLALEQAAAYIAHEQITMGDYLNQWQSDKKDVLGWCDKREMNYPVSVAVTYQRTFEKLSLTARAVLRLAAFLASEPLPIAMFEDGKKIVAQAANVIANEHKQRAKSKCNINKAIGDLAAYSMITKEAKTFTVHRIVQQVIRSRIPAKSHNDWLNKALRIVDDYAPTEASDVNTWPILDVLRPHLETIAQVADHAGITEPTSRLMSVLGSYLHYKGLYAQAEPWKCRALAIDEACLGKAHPDVAKDLNNLAALYQAMNRLAQAEPLIKRALEIVEKSLGKEHPNVATALNNLAQLYQDTNRLPEAEPLMKRALAIDEARLGKAHPNVARDLNNLAGLYQVMNRLTDAEPLMKRVVEIFEKSLGKDHPNVATALNNLAGLYQATNRLIDAELLMKRALAIDEVRLGKDHPEVARDLNNLAALYQDTNRLAQADPLYKRALAIDEARLGKDHPNVSKDLCNLAALYRVTNRLIEAEPLMKRALAIDEAGLGKDHPDVATDLNNLAQLYQATNRLAEAEPLMKRALEIDEAGLGKDNPNVAIRLNNLATLYQATNRLIDAEPLMERHLVIFLQFTRRTGHPHPHLEAAIKNYAGLLIQMGYSKDEVDARLKRLAPELFKSK